jgi:hypothetical protein
MIWLVVACASPVGTVVKLLEELKTNVDKDGAAEQKIYDKYACWCETTSSSKAKAIDQAKADIRTLSSEILALKGERATIAMDLETNAQGIYNNEQATHDLTVIREKSSSDVGQELSKMQQTVGALETAIKLIKAGYSLSAATSKLSKTDKALAGAVAAQVMNVTNHPAVTTFLENGGKNLVVKKVDYEPLSEKVLAVLESLYSTFSANLWASQAREETSRQTFDTVTVEKHAELTLLDTTMKTKESLEAEKAQEQAVKEQQLLDLQDQIEADKVFFDGTVTACQDESSAWDERSRRRREELAGLEKALEILGSDSNRELFDTAFNVAEVQKSARVSPRLVKEVMSFVQIRSREEPAEDFNASEFAESGVAPVLTAIDNMTEELKAEEALDIEQNTWCINETEKYYWEAEHKKRDIKVLESKIKRLEHSNKMRDDELARIDEQNTTLLQEMDDALAIRVDENSVYAAARDKDVQAMSVLNETNHVLNAFFKNNSLDLNAEEGAGAPQTFTQTLLQRGRRQPGLPEFEVSADQAPDTVATGEEYGGRRQDNRVVIDMLSMLYDNLDAEIRGADLAENKSKADYEAYVNDSKAMLATWVTSKTNLEEAKATDLSTIDQLEGMVDVEEGELGAIEDYRERIRPNCEWIMRAFDGRLQQRADEMNGLVDAKALLAGANPAALLSRTTEVQKTATKLVDVKHASTDELLDSLDADKEKWTSKARVAQLIARHKMFTTKVAPRKAHGHPKPGVAVDDTSTAETAARAGGLRGSF